MRVDLKEIKRSRTGIYVKPNKDMKPSYTGPTELAKRIGGLVPIIWAPVPLLVFRQEDRGTGAHKGNPGGPATGS